MNGTPRRRRAGVPVVLMLVLAFVAASCAKDDTGSSTQNTFAASLDKEASAGAPKPGGNLVYGLAAETSSWNPYVGQWAGSAYTVGNAIFDPLAAIDEQGKARPYLAEAFTPNADFTEWKVKLRPGISFHNGEPFNAAAVKANLEYGKKSGLTALVFETMQSVEVQDDLTAVVKMSKPWSTFPITMAAQPGYMAAPKMLADEANGGSNPVGTGPFVFNNWVRDSSLKVRKNPNYWQKGLPYLDSVEFKVITDIQGRGQALEAGTIDAMEIGTPDALLKYTELAKTGQLQMFTDVKGETDETIIALNTTKAPFDDPIARQAIAVGLNQDELSEISYQKAFPPARGPFAEGSPYYISPQEAGYPEFNLEKAKALVAQYSAAHGGAPLKFTALIPPDPTYQAIAQTLQARAKEAGMEVELQTVEQTKLITSVLTGDYQASGFVLFNSPTLDRGYVFVASKPVAAPGLSLNFTRYDDPELRAAMDEARATDDPAKQIEAYKKVQKRMAVDLDKIFLVHNVSGVVYQNNVFGFLQTKFPGTDARAQAPGLGTPFMTSVWKQQAGN